MTQSFKEEWRKLQLVESCTPDVNPVSLLGQAMWSLDTAIRAEFKSAIEQYEQGLLHSMELLEALQMIVEKQR